MDRTDLFRLDGKAALVTGAARGLGREISLCLARHGASLILADVASCEETQALVEQTGARATAVAADVSHEVQVENLAKQAKAACDGLDIVVNNAGISQLSYTPTEELTAEEWDRIVTVNLRGTFLCCKHLGKAMMASGGGSIVNIASTAGITGVPRAPAYCASKAGIILLTKSLALEWAPHHIRVNAIAPHYLETDLTHGLRTSEKVYKGLIRPIPFKRFAKPREITGALLLLASDAGSYMTGAVLPVDGGYLSQ